jgi:pristinamycin I synthase-3/4
MAAELEGGLLVSFQYRRDRFEPATIERLARSNERLLDAIAARPETRIAEPPVREWNATAVDFPGSGSLLERFAAEVSRRPEAPALVFGGAVCSYRELATAAGRIAAGLAKRGIGREAIVAILAERSLELPAAILGCLWAGAAYLPIDPGHPVGRIAEVLADAGPRLVLAQPGLLGCLPESAVASLLLDTGLTQFPDAPLPDMDTRPHPEQLAYVIYTAGSTGSPRA